jgi:DNA repair protein RadA/Sms
MGKCPDCGTWDSFVEERVVVSARPGKAGVLSALSAPPVSIDSIGLDIENRLHTSIQEFDRVLGGGLVSGTLILIGGDPGIGKSTLMLQALYGLIETCKPEVVVIDSIQTMFNGELTSAPGSVSQVREATVRLMLMAKRTGIPTFLVGHVTKDGAIAGPKLLEHMVDTVLYTWLTPFYTLKEIAITYFEFCGR